MEQKKKDQSLKLFYIELYLRAKNIIISPSLEWAIIRSENKDINGILSNYLLPLIGLCTISTFISFLINLQEINFELALKHSVVTFTSFFGGLFLAYAILCIIIPYYYSASKPIIFSLVGYPSTLIIIIAILVNLLPDLVLLYLGSLYSYFIIWNGVKSLLGLKPNNALSISIIITFLIHFSPFLVYQIFLKLLFN